MRICLLIAFGLLATAVCGSAGTVHYVSLNSPAPVAPYTNWLTAATNIQDAVDLSGPGDEIVVTNGVYAAGGRVVQGNLTNRLAITRPVLVRSVNGPTVTSIRGFQTLGNPNDAFAIRCVYLTNDAALAGFTLTNGATRDIGDMVTEQSGGGIWCAGKDVSVSNCVIAGNAAAAYGGGAFGGTLVDCTLAANTAGSGGSACSNNLTSCVLRDSFAGTGAGAFACQLTDCLLTNNFGFYGGAVHSCTVTNSSLLGNAASSFGGGAHTATLANCVLAGNSAYYGGGAYSSGLAGCLLATNSAESFGGGAYSSGLTNCTVTSNSAESGGGAYGGSLSNCQIEGNTASTGGGAYSASVRNSAVNGNKARTAAGGIYGGTIFNCTITGNSAASTGGGVVSATLANCILYYNRAVSNPNYQGGTLSSCCTTPAPANGNNIEAEPQLANFAHLSAGSPCRGAGTAGSAGGTDIDGEPWSATPSIGCDEYVAGGSAGPLDVAILCPYTNVAVGFPVDFTATINGWATASRWDFGDGTVVSNRPYATHAWSSAGSYGVKLRGFNDANPGGISSTVMVQVVAQPVHYVAPGSSGPTPPFGSWATAATNLQDAVDAVSVAGALVLVSNGVYAVGGRVVDGGLTNRLAVLKPMVVRSLNGPNVTMIRGSVQPMMPNPTNAARCVYLAEGATLSGFTLTNGNTRSAGDAILEQSGAGVWCASDSCIVSNCVITGNAAASSGGGVFFGRVANCTIASNTASSGGGANASLLSICTLSGNSAVSGGAAYSASLQNCMLTGNSASNYGGALAFSTAERCTLNGNRAFVGGAAYSSVLNNALLTGNTASSSGGGAYGEMLNNCTLVGNSAASYGGGAAFATLNNSIVYYNTALSGSNYYSGGLDHCCTSPIPEAGFDNFDYAPNFVDQPGGNFRLATNSPCINAGRNSNAQSEFDLDGQPRNVDGTVDVGAYEVPAAVADSFITWLLRYGLPPDGSANSLDTDGDGMDNWHEFIAGTDPTNSTSAFRILKAEKMPVGTLLTWQSVTGRTYFVQRCLEIGAQPLFVGLATNLAGQPGQTSWLDTNSAVGASGVFYRVGVSGPTPLSGRSRISFAWLERFALPNDGSADFADPDHDGMNNWQEWTAGTDPTNSASALRMISATDVAGGVMVSWLSVTNRTYSLERSTNLSSPGAFGVLTSNLPGMSGATSYVDTNAGSLLRAFYRVHTEH